MSHSIRSHLPLLSWAAPFSILNCTQVLHRSSPASIAAAALHSGAPSPPSHMTYPHCPAPSGSSSFTRPAPLPPPTYSHTYRFFIFYLITFGMCVFSTAVFRTIAALTRHETKAQAVGAGMLCLVINTCGFTLTRSKCGRSGSHSDAGPCWAHLFISLHLTDNAIRSPPK